MISNGSEKSFLEVDDALPGVADFSSLNDIRLIMFELSVTAFAIVVAIESSWSGRFVATSSLTEEVFSNETDLSFSDFLVPNNDESVEMPKSNTFPESLFVCDKMGDVVVINVLRVSSVGVKMWIGGAETIVESLNGFDAAVVEEDTTG